MAAPAYSYRNTARQHAPARRSAPYPEAPRVRTVRGAQTNQTVRVLPSSVTTLAVVIAVVLVVVAAISFTRIYLSSQAIVTSVESEQIASSIATARSEGSVLEVQSTVMANATTVKQKATDMGMADPADVAYITLPEDVVAVCEDGTLSLTESICRASGSVAGE
ncbi:MAG: cell division protein FtsL [Coriobacteriia bacterium]|nr:cell division protein FtsL [Coriobacteriia bacterium]